MSGKNPSGHPDKKRRGPERSQRRQMAEAAGLSRHQMYESLAIAAVPEDVFEALVESDDPPTPTQMANLGRAYQRGEEGPELVRTARGRHERVKVCPHCGGPL